MKKAPLVSIVVPVYNVEKYLDRCIQSLVDQTYKNIEVLLIDDGSSDASGFLCDQWAKKDLRVKTFHKENGGLSDARNYGLERMCGENVTFIDSDDFVDIHYIEYLVKLIDEGADIAATPIQSYFNLNEINYQYNRDYDIVPTEEAVRRILIRDGISHSACGKLYKSFIWKDLRFPYKKLYEDYYTTFDAFHLSEKVAVGKASMYFYFQRPDSIMHYACNEKTVTIINASEIVTPKIIKYWPNLKVEALGLQSSLCLKCLQSIYESKSSEFTLEAKKALSIVHKNAKDVLFSNKIRIKDRLKIVLSYFPKKLFLVIYNIFDGNKTLVTG